jgi:hypothetical protein
MRNPVRTITLALAVLVMAAPTATAATPDPFMGNPFNRNQVLTYRWGAGGAPPAAIKAAIKDAIEDANTTRESKAPTFDHASGADSTITYGVSAPCGENGLACFRRDAPTWFAVYLRENGHRFDWGTLRWCEATGRPRGCFDAENITLDELGHVLGLDHHVNLPDDSDYGDAVVQTYSRVKPEDGYNAHAFGRCDVATLQQVYDVRTTSTLYSTCLDVPSETTISASTTWLPGAGWVSFTATLRSAGTGKLSNNLVSGRVLVLQRRTSSGWTDALTMTRASAGTYTAGLYLLSPTTVRAVFRRPSNEGLRGSSSDPLTVTVSPCPNGTCPLSVAPR